MKRSSGLLLGMVSALLLFGCGGKKDEEPSKAVQAAEARGNAMIALEKGDWLTVISESDKSIKLDPKVAETWWVRATARFHLTEYKRAEADCSVAINLDSKYYPAYSRRGWTRIMLEKYPEAIEDFSTYIKLRPKDPTGYEGRAVAHGKNGDDQAGAADLKKADELKAALKKRLESP